VNGGEQDIVFRFSADGGVTWPGEASRIHTPGSRNGMPGVAVLPGGALLAIFEGFWGPAGWGRFTVNAAVSADGGASWPGALRQLVHAPPAAGGRNAGSPQLALCPAAAAAAAAQQQPQRLCAVFMDDEPAAGAGPWPAGASVLASCADARGSAVGNWSAPRALPTATATGFWPSVLALDGALHAVYQTPAGAAQLVDAALDCGGGGGGAAAGGE